MNFLQALQVRGVAYRKHPKPGEVWVCCPFCHEDRFRLGINFRNNIGHCFNCTWKSRKAVPEYLQQIRFSVAVDSGDDEPETADKAAAVELPHDFTFLWTLEPSDGPEFYKAREYLEKRGVTEAQMRKHGLGASWSGRFAYRVIFPVTYRERLCGIVARDFSGVKKPKYLNSVGDKTVYGIERRKRREPLVLSEGCLKALAIERAVPELASGSLLGSSVTEEQIARIRECAFEEVVLFSDPDIPGRAGMLKVARALSDSGIGVKIVFPIPHKQADELTPEEVRAMLTTAVVNFTYTTALRIQGSMCLSV